MWSDESWTEEAEAEFVFETGRRAGAPVSRPRGGPSSFRPPRRPPLPGRPRPRGRRGGSLLWDEPPLAAAACPGPWSGDLDDPETLRSMQAALNRMFDQLIRRAGGR